MSGNEVISIANLDASLSMIIAHLTLNHCPTYWVLSPRISLTHSVILTDYFTLSISTDWLSDSWCSTRVTHLIIDCLTTMRQVACDPVPIIVFELLVLKFIGPLTHCRTTHTSCCIKVRSALSTLSHVLNTQFTHILTRGEVPSKPCPLISVMHLIHWHGNDYTTSLLLKITYLRNNF